LEFVVCRKTTNYSEDVDCEYSDYDDDDNDDDDDDVTGRRRVSSSRPSTSSQDASLLHRHRGGFGLPPTAFDDDFSTCTAAEVLPGFMERAGGGHQLAERLSSFTSSTSTRTTTSPSSDRTLVRHQPFVYADGVLPGGTGVDNGLDSTTYF